MFVFLLDTFYNIPSKFYYSNSDLLKFHGIISVDHLFY